MSRLRTNAALAAEMAVDAVHGVPAGVPLESLPRLPPAGVPSVDWPPDERRRVVALRLVAPQPERFAGARCARRWRLKASCSGALRSSTARR